MTPKTSALIGLATGLQSHECVARIEWEPVMNALCEALQQAEENLASTSSGSVPDAEAPATPLPWRAQAMDSPFRAHFGDGYEIYSGDAYIATLKIDGAKRQKRDAEYIVHTANSHPRLTALLTDALEYFEERSDVNYEGDGPNEAMHFAQTIRELLGIRE